MSNFRLDVLLSPRSVAVIGASPKPTSLGRTVLANIRSSGFAGRLGLVNPRYGSVDGVAASPRVRDLGFVPDLVIVTTPAAMVPAAVDDAGAAGAAGAIVISAGLGHGKGSLSEAAAAAARKHGMRLIGPNCIGAMMPQVRLNASFAAHMPKLGHVALISQSGAIVAGMVDWAAEKQIGFSGIVSIGDQVDVDIADLLDHFALDMHTRAILLYVEAVKDARKFMSAARAAARIKPVVVVKSGRMAQGASAAATHTGALAGADAVYDAAFRRAGMLRVFDLRELFDCAETLGRIGAPRGKRLAIVTNGGGIGVLAVDRLAELGGVAATLSAETERQLKAALPPHWSPSHPVDLGGDADAVRYVAAIEALIADKENDAILVMNVQTAIAGASDIAAAVAHISRARGTGRAAKPLLAVWVGADERVLHQFDEAGIPNFPTEDDAVRGFMHLVHHREVVEALSEVPPSLPKDFAPDVAAARAVIAAAMAEGRHWLDPVEIGTLFQAYQIPIAAAAPARDAEEAVKAAGTFFRDGHKVVLKVWSRDITHKSDVGGVILNLADADAVRDAATTILTRACERRPEARISGVMVQPMIVRPKARELILGIADDPTFGPVILFGHGGTGVEVIDDRALALPPLDLKLAHDLIRSTRVSRLLDAYRDVPAARQDEIALTLVKLAQLSADIPEIRELDINPLLADENGALAVDARVVIAPPQRKFAGLGNARFAVRPYPSEWERQLTVKGSWRIFARPIRPDDEPLLHDFLRHITQQDLRLRFFAPMKDFSHAFIARLSQIDYARAMAFVAFDEASRELLGVVRLHSDSIYETGEFAILLRSDLKGKGLGWALMELIIDYARSEGLRTVSGKVLRENTVMLQMCRDLGFAVTADPEDRDICDVRLPL